MEVKPLTKRRRMPHIDGHLAKTFTSTSTITAFGRNISHLFPELKYRIGKIKKKEIVVHEIGIGANHAGGTEPYELYRLVENAGKKPTIFAIDHNRDVLKKIAKVNKISEDILVDKLRYFKKIFPKQRKTIRRIESKNEDFAETAFSRYNVRAKIPVRAKQGVHLVHADIKTSAPAKRADLTCCFHVFEHYEAPQQEQILRNISDAMNRSGYFVTDAEGIGKTNPEKFGFKEVKFGQRTIDGSNLAESYFKIYKKVK